MGDALKALIALAKTDTQAALRRARHEPLPANRCQQLAWIARFAPDADVAPIAGEALAAAAEVRDPYWTVAIAAWGLRALVDRGLGAACKGAARPVLERARRIAHPVRRMDALELLLHAVFDVADVRGMVLVALIDACRSASSWKVPRCLARTAVLLGRTSPGEADMVLRALGDGPHRRQALRRIAAGGGPPREFFV